MSDHKKTPSFTSKDKVLLGDSAVILPNKMENIK